MPILFPQNYYQNNTTYNNLEIGLGSESGFCRQRLKVNLEIGFVGRDGETLQKTWPISMLLFRGFIKNGCNSI